MDTINQMCLPTLPGYAPRGTRDRAGQARLSLAELDAALGRFIVKVYNHRPHSETGQPPQARWEAGGFLPHLPESLEQLDLLLLTVTKPRKIHQDGIRFQGLRYLDPVLAAYVGEPVIIRYDPRDLAEIRVFHHDGYLCRAVCPELADRTIGLKDILSARNARRRDLKRAIGERTSLVERLLADRDRPGSDPPRRRATRPAAAPLPGRMAMTGPARPEFLTTKEHRRFAEFADTVRRDRYIGLCYGQPGVGKTLSGRRYAHWDILEPHLSAFRFLTDPEDAPRQALESRAVVYTPKVHTTPKTLDKDLTHWHDRLSWTIEALLHPDRNPTDYDQHRGSSAELLIIDEADRLTTASLEQLRDHHDRTGIGVILIGMPGIEKRLARYPQLYSRVGFLHHYRPLSDAELARVLTTHWPHLHLDAQEGDTAAAAVAAITRITGGNFRLTTRLIAQIERILEINAMATVTTDVIDAARQSLVIGTT